MPGRKPITQCTDKEWKTLVGQVRATIPPPSGYIWRLVRSVKVGKEGRQGDCELKPGKDGKRGEIVIRVLKGMSESETEWILIHELGHAFDQWGHHGWAGDHSDTFWIWVGRVYRRHHGMETG